MTEIHRPVFIVASERSGTNLLRRRISENQATYVGPSPAHFLKHLFYQEPYFGDLQNDSDFLAFLQHALNLVTIHFAPWQVDWTAESLMDKFGQRRRGAIEVMDFMMTSYARQLGFDQYVCKDNHLYEFALEIARQIPGARFLYLHRDPRDFVLSQMARPGAIQSAIRFARLWSYEQTKAIKAHQVLSAEGRSLRVSYEHLVQNEDEAIQTILNFLGVRYEPRSAGSEVVLEAVHEWKNLDKATIKDNFGKYREEMPLNSIRAVNGTCLPQMQYLGYDPEEFGSRKPSRRETYFEYALGYMRSKVNRKSKPVSDSHKERDKILSKYVVNYRNDS